MISKEHKKHSHITRPSYGNFHRNEWSIIASSNAMIEHLAFAVIEKLSPFYKCAYIDSLPEVEKNKMEERLTGEAMARCYTFKDYHLFSFNKTFNRFSFRQMFMDADLALVNGNFHQAKAQVIVVDANTQLFLQQASSPPGDVQLILLADDREDLPDFVKQSLPNWTQLPVYHISEIDQIAGFFLAQLEHARPLIKGLVLAGGKSVRMGADKGSLAWHGKEQRYYMADLLQTFCNEVFISCRADQHDTINENYRSIEDSFTSLGPYGAILSAFREQPDCAWLVTACDMPFLDERTLRYLIENRNVSAMATTFESPRGSFPEPLITIWEPKSYPILLSMLSQGYTCPRKALENNDVCLLKPPHPEALINVNTPEEKEKAENILKSAF